jgi:phosphoribosylaminoimidazole carboxylase
MSSRDTKTPLVVVTMGSDSDLPVMKACFDILERFRVPYDFTITSAHRTPHRMVELGKSAASRGIRVLIAAGTFAFFPFPAPTLTFSQLEERLTSQVC